MDNVELCWCSTVFSFLRFLCVLGGEFFLPLPPIDEAGKQERPIAAPVLEWSVAGCE